jgi:hypothetical protein
MTSTFRGRLLAGAALGLGLAVVAPQQAEAACVVNPAATPVTGTVTCATTTTNNSTYAGVSPASDREYVVNTTAGTVTGTVSPGAVVSGFGLAFTDATGGGNTLAVVNDGTVSANAAGIAGTGVLDITAAGTTNISYTGAGDIIGTGTVFDGLVLDTTGTGNITAVVGGSVSTDNGAGFGIWARNTGTAGNISLTTTAGETIRSGFVGIISQIANAASAGTLTVVNNAAIGSPTGAPNTLDLGITATSAGTGAVSVTNNGAIGSATDRLVASGIQASITNAASAAPLSVTGTGAIFASGLGLDVDNAGTGTTTVNYTGAINTTGATGVDVDALTGATAVTLGAVTAATNAVTVTSTGAQTITLNGVTTGTAGSGVISDTTGARTIAVGAGGNVTGATQAILLTNTGAATITNAGTIGAAVTDVAINAAAASAATITNSGTIRGDVILTAGADTLTNTGILTAGDLNFGAGADTLTNSAAGTITVAGATPILGLETFNNAGTVTAATGLTFDGGATALTNTGTLNAQGTLDFGAGADSFANSGAGIFNLTGATTLAGLETFTNSGRINLNTFTLTGPAVAFNNTGTIDTSGSAGLAGFTTFSNAGILDLAPGIFTVPAAVFTNTGTILADEGASTITGQTSFASSGTIDLQDGAVGDILTINSAFVGSGGSNLMIDFTGAASDELIINGAASGSTAVNAAYLGGGFNLDGVLVVDTTTSTASAFVLGTVTGDSPLLAVDLVRIGQDFFLTAAPTEATFNPLVVPGFATDIWYQSANEVFAETVKPATTSGLSFWGDVYISREKYGDDDDSVVIDGVAFDVDNELKTKRHGIQGGVDYGFDAGRVGLTGGYGWARAEGNAQADLRAKGWNLGIYGQFGGLTGFHGEFLAKHDEYDGEFTDGAFDGEEFDIRANGIDGSLGYRFGMGGAAVVDVHAGVSHVRTKVDDISAFGFNYDIGKLTSTRGRAGVRAILGGSLAPYVDATVYHEFSDDGEVQLFDGANTFDFDTGGKGTWARFEAGLSGNDGPGPILAAWADFGDRKGLGLRAGWRLGGRVAEAAPPPPAPAYVAPPAPPPPATQTCPDGSVILATDACPPPPPPPPPAPEPERG